MSNSTVRLYDLLKSEYPGQVYLGQFDQGVDLRSATGVILLQEINETPTQNKDVIKRDQIVYNIQVIGTSQKVVDAVASNLRDVVQPYNDEYIMLMVYDSTFKDYDEDAEIYRKVLQFTCWPEPDGLNKPTEYYEHIVRFFAVDNHEILNIDARNYLPITWTYFGNNSTRNWSAPHTYGDNKIDVWAKMVEDFEVENGIIYKDGAEELVIQKDGFGAYFEDQTFLIRVRKDIPGQFNSGL